MSDFLDNMIDIFLGVVVIVFSVLAIILLVALVLNIGSKGTNFEPVSVYRICAQDKIVLMKDGKYRSYDTNLLVSDPDKVCGAN